jgi:hypothetical protein
VKRPRIFVGIWQDENAYFPHLDGASVMTFEANDLGDTISGTATPESAFAWTMFLCLHTDLESSIEPVRN